MLKLAFINAEEKQPVWLIGPKMTLGSATNNDIQLQGGDIASVHAELRINDEELIIVRRAAGVKLIVNDKPVEKGRRVKVDDVIVVGSQSLKVLDPKKTAKPLAPTAEVKSSQAKQAGEGTGWSLKANHPTLANKVYPLKQESLIGRAQECDIFLAAAHLSRRHALLTVDQGNLYVKDLGSANGTFLNGERITEARVRRGDELRFDTLNFGVLGPADDMDKTTIRPSMDIPVRSTPQKPAKVTHTTLEGVKATKSSIAVNAGSVTDSPSLSSRKSLYILVGLIVVAVGVGGLYVFGA